MQLKEDPLNEHGVILYSGWIGPGSKEDEFDDIYDEYIKVIHVGKEQGI